MAEDGDLLYPLVPLEMIPFYLLSLANNVMYALVKPCGKDIRHIAQKMYYLALFLGQSRRMVSRYYLFVVWK